jgi:hypothetical protein
VSYWYILLLIGSIAAVGCTPHPRQPAPDNGSATLDAEPRFTPPDLATVAAMRARLEALPPADHAKWRPGNWANPVVVVTRSGVIVHYDERRRRVGDGQPMALRQLPEALASVPPQEWPYGRWVLIAESSLGDGQDDPSTDDLDATRRLLRDLGVESQGIAT